MIRLSCDDGCASDVRVAELAKKYGIECVFYWPVEWHSLAYDNGYEPLTYEQAVSISNDFEIGSHTLTHRHLTKLPIQEAKLEISDSRVMLECLFGEPVNKFASPRGYSNPELDEYILKHYDSHRKTKQPGLVHIHPDSGANGNRPWQDCITDETTELFCHSWELDKYNLWEQLEDYLKENA